MQSIGSPKPLKTMAVQFFSVGGFPFTIITFVAMAITTIAQKEYNHNLKVKYFTDVSMICDDNGLNVTRQNNIKSLTWIFTDARAVDANSDLDPTKFRLSGPEGLVAGDITKLQAYNLTAIKIDDSVFGYYTCIVVYDSGSISAIRWGLNVDGADFSDLIEGYKESAMIGGIAAAALFVLVGGTCILWEFRFSNRHSNDRSSSSDGTIGKPSSIEDDESVKFTQGAYNNQGYSEEEKGITETSLTVDTKTAVEDAVNVEEKGEDPEFKIPRYHL